MKIHPPVETIYDSIENFKRRKMLVAPWRMLDESSRVFFDRILTVKKTREFNFSGKPVRAKKR